MSKLIARFAHWLLSLSETPELIDLNQPIQAPNVVLFAPEPARCDKCGEEWTRHPCAARNVTGDVAFCATCGSTMPKGSVRQHTGAWICAGCKSRLTLGG